METIPWLEKAREYKGQHELKGPGQNNQFIIDCFKFTTYQATTDETPWCSAFMNRIMAACNMKGTNSAAAKSWCDYGSPCELKPGAIVVFQWEDGGHHVSMVDHLVNDEVVACIGGNQGDQVSVVNFKTSRIITIHWPEKA